ncbi:MAG: integrase [Bacteroidetes bacterium]|nr:MAG: integrase [Bacteroidota bacterium]
MKTLIAEKIIHKNEIRIKLTYEYNTEINNFIKKIRGRKWSKSLKSWHLPYKQENWKQLKTLCEKHNVKLLNKNYGKSTSNIIQNKSNNNMLPEVQKSVSEFKQFMTEKRFSPNTIKTYLNSVNKFFEYYPTKMPDEISLNDIRNFNTEYVIKNNLSISYQNQLINALKTFYQKIYNKNLNINLLERPVKQKQLPDVLSQQEVKQIITSIKNIKHKTIISLIYSAGLRRSELINFKIKDIDSERKTIKISQSKGNKDRYVGLSEKILLMLRQYYKEYRPEKWLFEGAGGKQYSPSSIRSIFERAKKDAGISKKITLHGLRHSYATHLHEKGIDIRVIQELLGHNSIKTTEIYTHISKKRINDVRSPLDDLDI